MCLIIKAGQEPIRAEKDITVYKTVKIKEGIIRSYYEEFRYTPNITYHEDFTISCGIANCLDELELKQVYEYLDTVFIPIPEAVISIHRGYHFAFNKDRLGLYHTDDIIEEFIIPKGSLYYVGIDNELGVSNRIILK